MVKKASLGTGSSSKRASSCNCCLAYVYIFFLPDALLGKSYVKFDCKMLCWNVMVVEIKTYNIYFKHAWNICLLNRSAWLIQIFHLTKVWKVQSPSDNCNPNQTRVFQLYEISAQPSPKGNKQNINLDLRHYPYRFGLRFLRILPKLQASGCKKFPDMPPQLDPLQLYKSQTFEDAWLDAHTVDVVNYIRGNKSLNIPAEWKDEFRVRNP